MAVHIWSILCMFVLTDQQTNSISYINALETIAAPSFPAIMPSAAIGTEWQKSSEEQETLEVRLKLISPGGAERILIPPSSVVLTTPRHRFNMNLQSVNLDVPGPYQFIVEYSDGRRWRQASNLPLNAVLRPVTPQTRVTP